MSNFNIFTTLRNRAGLQSLIWATIQQLVVAASTYFIIVASQLISHGQLEQALPMIVGFSLSLILVYIPNTISLIYLQKWRLKSFASFVDIFIARNHGRTTWAHARDKDKYEPWLTNEALSVYDNATNILYQVYSILMSTLLNLAVIALMLDSRIMAWYAAGALILLVSSRYFQSSISTAALSVQTGRNNLSKEMLAAWENIFIGNAYNLRNWTSRFEQKLSSMQTAAVKYDRVRSVVSGLTVSLSILIIALGNWIYIDQNRHDLARITALIITFPRQLMMVQNIFAFFNVYLSWSGLAEQFKTLGSMISLTAEKKDVRQFIDVNRITVSNENGSQRFPNVKSLFGHLNAATPGRYTLRAGNGAGKSTLLSLLAEATNHESFYLPSRFGELAFAGAAVVAESDGNRLIAAMQEIATLKGIKFLLLDEWDANLDSENIARVDQVIAKLSLDHIVIEARHRVSVHVAN